MIDQTNEAAVRARAYQLWEESGGGDGNHEDHWRRAEAEQGGPTSDAALTADEAAGVPVEAERHVDGVSPLTPVPAPIAAGSVGRKPQRKA